MLAELRALAAMPADTSREHRRGRPSISELVREALRDYLARREKLRREETDRAALARHRKLLAKQSAALVHAQAKP